MARRFDPLARLWDASASSTSASAWTPATRTPAARSWSTSSTGSRRSPAGSTWCTPTTPGTRSTPARDRHANFGDGTIDADVLVAVVRRGRARPVVCETPARGPGGRHRLPARAARFVTRVSEHPPARPRRSQATPGRRTGACRRAGRLLLAVIVLLAGITLVPATPTRRAVSAPSSTRGPQPARLHDGPTTTSVTRTSSTCGWAATSTLVGNLLMRFDDDGLCTDLREYGSWCPNSATPGPAGASRHPGYARYGQG